MEKTKMRKHIFHFLLIAGIVLGYLWIMGYLGDVVRKDEICLDDGWTVSMNHQGNQEETKSVSLSTFSFPVTQKGDTVLMECELPKQNVERPILQFIIYHSVVSVLVDGKEIYQYGEQQARQGDMVGSGYYWVELPEHCQGKKISLLLRVTEDEAFSSIEAPKLISSTKYTRNFLLNNITDVIISVFLLGAGVLVIFVVLFIGRIGSEYTMLLYMGMFAADTALWIMCNTGIIYVLVTNRNLVSYIEYPSLYIAPAILMLFVMEAQEKKQNRNIIGGMNVVLLTYIAIVTTLNSTNILHFPKTLMIFHMIGVISVIVTIWVNVRGFEGKRTTYGRTILKGMGLLLLFSVLDIIRFNVDKYIHLEGVDISHSILPIGILSFVIYMAVSYVHRLIQTFYDNVEKKTLMKMAYTDALTSIGNRAMCETIFREKTGQPATVINFDLNKFKQINDVYGHSTGDQLLVEFAGHLKNFFETYGYVGRMGGDEFVAVLNTNDEKEVETLIVKFKRNLEQANQESGRVYKMLTSAGYATNRNNLGKNLWELYEEADKKMYEDKENQAYN